MNAHAALHSSASASWLTPKEIVRAAEQAVGGVFDLDPASTKEANGVVRAQRIFTEHDDGLSQEWYAKRLFLNPPGGSLAKPTPLSLRPDRKTRSSQVLWWDYLVHEWTCNRVHEAIFVGFSIELLQAAQVCHRPPQHFPLCVPDRRIRFEQLEGGKRVPADQPTHGNVIIYLPDTDSPYPKFEKAFRNIGVPFNLGVQP